MQLLQQDLRYAARMLVKKPMFTQGMILVLTGRAGSRGGVAFDQPDISFVVPSESDRSADLWLDRGFADRCRFAGLLLAVGRRKSIRWWRCVTNRLDP